LVEVIPLAVTVTGTVGTVLPAGMVKVPAVVV